MITNDFIPYFQPELYVKDEISNLNDEPEIIVVDLAERDKKIEMLNKILTQRKRQMIDQYKTCKNCNLQNLSCNSNNNMSEIIDNYQKYFHSQISTKENQLINIKNIDSNLDELINNKSLSDENIQNIKKDQEEVFDKMKKIEDELKELLDVIKK